MHPNRFRTFALLAAVALTATLVATPAVAGEKAPAAEVLSLYGAMHQAMSGDTADGVAAAAKRIREIAEGESARAADAAPWQVLASAAATVAGDDLETLRDQFRGFSKAMAMFVNSVGADGAQIWFCPMADGYWIQAEGDDAPRNPYYGASMLKCGSKVDQVKG